MGSLFAVEGCRILWGSALKSRGAAPWLWPLEKGRVAAGAGTLRDVTAVGDTSPWPSWTRLTWVGACGSVCGCAVLCFSVLCFCAMLFYSVLCFCSVLCCSVLCFSLLCCSVFLCCAIFLCCAMFFCAMVFCAVLFCSVLCFCAVPFCSVLCFSVPFCSVLYCVSVPCCVFLCRAVFFCALLAGAAPLLPAALAPASRLWWKQGAAHLVVQRSHPQRQALPAQAFIPGRPAVPAAVWRRQQAGTLVSFQFYPCPHI